MFHEELNIMEAKPDISLPNSKPKSRSDYTSYRQIMIQINGISESRKQGAKQIVLDNIKKSPKIKKSRNQECTIPVMFMLSDLSS